MPAYDYTCALTGYRLTTIDDGSIVEADRRFHESGPDAHLLKPLAGTPIQLPRNTTLNPDPRHLAWHRKRHEFASDATG